MNSVIKDDECVLELATLVARTAYSLDDRIRVSEKLGAFRDAELQFLRLHSPENSRRLVAAWTRLVLELDATCSGGTIPTGPRAQEARAA